LVKREDPTWGKPSIEIEGTFTWTLPGKKEVKVKKEKKSKKGKI
jgi:hypothetical protein